MLACASSPSAPEGAPVFGAPLTMADHNRPYVYVLEVMDPEGDPVTIDVVQRPAWLQFDPASLTLSGTAGWPNIGSHAVSIQATDGAHESTQEFTIVVAKGEIVCDQDFGDPATSDYVLPYREGSSYRVIQSYCPSNPAWGHHNWFAYDFDLATGDTILSSRGGQVLFVRDGQPDIGGRCGMNGENIILIRHDDGTVMHYVHLTTNGALVAGGERVGTGEPIGLSGNSGCSSGPHLHVALFRNTSDYNRQSTLPFNYRNAVGDLDANRGLRQSEVYLAASPAVNR
jgi:murein DD-endopeptidase MepM/ murein hydrolase activator NlpD